MKNSLLILLENSKNYTLGVAQLMPENRYTFKPTDGVWNKSARIRLEIVPQEINLQTRNQSIFIMGKMNEWI